MMVKVCCVTCKHDYREEDKFNGLLVSLCRKGSSNYEPHKATDCCWWESK